ncbi:MULTISPECIES: sigma-70 family RNA polymerase sigma factor [Clostridium]|uniref:RNA polymerase sigma-70 factor, ECF subfamily n=1 Tax=Clostridium cadaveris TaxID=1529 RepID=A0A1I2MKF7_9CLOT|nr:sigma-70 family RNA polymerase sigma factor [Clostridium cadaveris]MDU4953379.1 sigma-70 family RNA polymerase sigma factor [Clostridium sp.]MDM8311501.1 sigma-70 family RNA polymerase sigma factor [Clostridium cadaveris]MDY4948492.1 sigma-70 family RNA polymerase sigma factor [Clostridium cadaveris]NME64880.1 sigma-70 family RNA polymerase sigma factor [Clostridium cadaveris]NWK11559.1 sigma-70 family RNA polymerase sigma factor [Clostridium cadaveris]
MRIDRENFLTQMRRKDEKSLEYIIDIYSSLVNGIVRRVLEPLKNEGIIEECISDVFLSVWNNIDKFRGNNDNFKSWIGGISKYKAIDYYRKYSTEKGNTEIIDNSISNGENLEENIIKGIETRNVMKLINELKEPDKSIFVMKFLFGYSGQKISDALGLTVSNINTRVSRGRKRLKEQFENISKEG